MSTDWYDRNPSASEFIISAAGELAYLAKLVNTGKSFSGKTITLANDINLGGKGWAPIGYTGYIGYYYQKRSYSFNGVFDGNGKTINGLYFRYVNTTDNGSYTAGLFGFVDSGTVKNLGIVNADLNGAGDGCDNIGIVAGWVGVGSVFNCYSSGMIIGGSQSRTGGVVGGSIGNVVNCHFSDIVKGNYNVGGVVGKIVGGNVTACYADGTVDGGRYVGGVVGDINDGNVANSYSTSEVNGDIHLGGVAGRALHGSITNCYSTSAVSGINCIGGVVGVIGGSTVTNSYFTGTVSGIGDYFTGDYNENLNGVGGVVGSVFSGLESNLQDYPVYGSNIVNNCAALNSIIKYNTSYLYREARRVVGRRSGGNITLSNNIAFDGMENPYDDHFYLHDWYDKSANSQDGADITAAEIRADGTIGGRFTAANGWTVENGKLPGIGAAVNMPEHLK
jgi:hypothetical protein